MDLGGQNGAKLAPESHQKSIPTSKGVVVKQLCFSLGKTMILKVLGVEVGRYLGIDFSLILVDFGGQVGAKFGSKIAKKIDPKRH